MICRALHALVLASGVMCLLTACSPSSLRDGSSSVSSSIGKFASGGLGLTKAEWEQKHILTDSSPDGRYSYDESPSPPRNGIDVYFWSDPGAPVENAPISRINLDLLPVWRETTGYTSSHPSLAQMEPLVTALLPADAVLEKTKILYSNQHTIVQTYSSDALATRYPTLSSGKTPWSPSSADSSPPNYKPGTITVLYSHGDPYVSISAGENGIPWRYTPPPPPPTPTWAPEPTNPPMPQGINTIVPEAVPTR
jgi:hypothetical protein